LKSLFLPFFIACILVAWPCWEAGRSFGPLEWMVFCWCLCALTINSLVFDYRDIGGDRRYGNRTIPTQLGAVWTLWLLAGLAANAHCPQCSNAASSVRGGNRFSRRFYRVALSCKVVAASVGNQLACRCAAIGAGFGGTGAIIFFVLVLVVVLERRFEVPDRFW
jgi:hypothetical protein